MDVQGVTGAAQAALAYEIPVIDGKMPVRALHKYHVWVRPTPDDPWQFGATALSATEALVCQNYVQASRPGMGVKVERAKPATQAIRTVPIH